MAVLNPLHLLEQARSLVRLNPGRKPRQIELRRAISAAYYAVFHQLSIAAADEFLGATLRSDPRYALIYRSIDHGQVRRLCEDAAKSNPPPKYARYLQVRPFTSGIKNFANALAVLQSRQHEADYDPSISLGSVDALYAIDLAERAIAAFNAAPHDERKLFLTFLLFPPR